MILSFMFFVLMFLGLLCIPLAMGIKSDKPPIDGYRLANGVSVKGVSTTPPEAVGKAVTDFINAWEPRHRPELKRALKSLTIRFEDGSFRTSGGVTVQAQAVDPYLIRISNQAIFRDIVFYELTHWAFLCLYRNFPKNYIWMNGVWTRKHDELIKRLRDKKPPAGLRGATQPFDLRLSK